MKLAKSIVLAALVASVSFAHAAENPRAQLERQAEQGDLKAARQLIYSSTNISNIPEVFRWRRVAASDGDIDSQRWLGANLHEGLGPVKKDDVEAVKWLKMGADAGDAYSQTILGEIYWEGSGGLQQNYEEAIALFR